MDMKISEMIEKLKEIKSEHGDLFVVSPSDEETILVTIRDEDVWVCHDDDMNIDNWDQRIGDLEYKKVLVLGER